VVGTVTDAPDVVNETDKPPDGATEFNVTVPVAPVPPITLVGLTTTLETEGGLIVRLAVFETPSRVAVILAEFTDPTENVPTENVMVDCPAGTVTEVGTVAS
jgi:hypothetical protein